jgi:hypothetical protein
MAAVTSSARVAIQPHQRRAVWIFAGAQFAYTAWFALAAYLALARAAQFAGHFYIPGQGDQYTANADVNSGWPWEFPVTMTAQLGPLLAPISLIAAIYLLVMLGYRRGVRALWLTLLGSTVAVAATVVVSWTSPGQSVIGWILD